LAAQTAQSHVYLRSLGVLPRRGVACIFTKPHGEHASIHHINQQTASIHHIIHRTVRFEEPTTTTTTSDENAFSRQHVHCTKLVLLHATCARVQGNMCTQHVLGLENFSRQHVHAKCVVARNMCTHAAFARVNVQHVCKCYSTHHVHVCTCSTFAHASRNICPCAHVYV